MDIDMLKRVLEGGVPLILICGLVLSGSLNWYLLRKMWHLEKEYRETTERLLKDQLAAQKELVMAITMNTDVMRAAKEALSANTDALRALMTPHRPPGSIGPA